MLTRIEGGDLTALDAKYHLALFDSFRNRHRSLLRQNLGSDSSLQEIEIEARALIELISHVENSLEDGIFCFKFSALRELYQNRLSSLELEKEINRVRFNERVLEFFSNAQQQIDGKNLVLVFEQGMKNSMQCEENAVILMKVAKIVRNDIL